MYHLKKKELEEALRLVNKLIPDITLYKKRELEVYTRLAALNPSEYEQKKIDSEKSLKTFQDNLDNYSIEELMSELKTFESNKEYLRQLEEKANKELLVLVKQTADIEKWYITFIRPLKIVEYFGSFQRKKERYPIVDWMKKLATSSSPILVYKEQIQNIENFRRDYRPYYNSDQNGEDLRNYINFEKMEACFSILAELTQETQFSDLLKVLNLFKTANMNGKLPSYMPIPFIDTIQTPTLFHYADHAAKRQQYWGNTTFSFKKYIKWDSFSGSRLEWHVDTVATDAKRLTEKQIEDLQLSPETSTVLKKELEDKLIRLRRTLESGRVNKEYGEARPEISWDSKEGRSYRNYGIEEFVPFVKKIQSLQGPAILQAIKSNDSEIIQFFLTMAPNNPAILNACDQAGETLLMAALRNKNMPVIEFLLAKKVHLSLKNKAGQTAMDIANEHSSDLVTLIEKQRFLEAAGTGDLEFVKKYSQEHLAFISNNQGNEALIEATRFGRLQVVQALLEIPGIEPSIIAEDLASQGGHHQITKLFQQTKFLRAASQGDLTSVQNYLAAHQKEEDMPVEIALQNALAHEHWSVVQVLIAHLKDAVMLQKVEEQARVKNPIVLHTVYRTRAIWEFIAAAGKSDEEQINIFKKYLNLHQQNIAAINAVNGFGDSALHVAARHGNLPAVQALLYSGADSSLSNQKGHTAEQEALQGNKLEVLHFFQGMAFLQLVENNNVIAIESFLKTHSKQLRALLNVRDKDGNSALVVAARSGNLAVMRALIYSGAVLSDIQEQELLLASEEAIKQGHPHIANLLAASTELYFRHSQGKSLSYRERLENIASQVDVSEFVDPIWLTLMQDPVTTADRQTFDRNSLREFFDKYPGVQVLPCPLTRKPIHRTILQAPSNMGIKNAIEELVKTEEEAFEIAKIKAEKASALAGKSLEQEVVKEEKEESVTSAEDSVERTTENVRAARLRFLNQQGVQTALESKKESASTPFSSGARS